MTALHLLVGVADERYALDVSDVVEVVEIGAITPVPGAPPSVLGVRNLRGQLVPVLDLAAVLEVQRRGEPSAIAVVERAGQPTGLAVDRLFGTTELPEDREPGEDALVPGATLFDGGFVGILDVGRLLDAVSGPAV